MDIEDIQLNKEQILKVGEEGSEYLDSLVQEAGFIENRQSFYTSLVRFAICIGVSIVFLIVANLITLTKPVGEPYLTTQDGSTIKIREYEVRKR